MPSPTIVGPSEGLYSLPLPEFCNILPGEVEGGVVGLGPSHLSLPLSVWRDSLSCKHRFLSLCIMADEIWYDRKVILSVLKSLLVLLLLLYVLLSDPTQRGSFPCLS